ncbi:DNA-binding helix-turn-helix protein [Enterococcus faecalis 06-MB-DW-09]|nr:DNA-binding helix-turn-helix protein [Enterococcus faecalis 06-MB-DW-09]
MDTDKIRRVLKEKRLAKNLSAQALGDIVGVDKTTIYRYEKGQIKKMPYNVLNKLSSALDIAPTFILGFTPSPDDNSIKTDSYVDKTTSIMKDLNDERQEVVYKCAEEQLEEQQKEKIVSLPKKQEVDTIAAHSDDRNKVITEEEKEELNRYLDSIDEKYDKKHNKNK